MPANETVGEKFRDELLEIARDKSIAVIESTAKLIRPGMSEADARKILSQVQKELSADRAWHPPQIRFGKNTLLPFGARGDREVRLQDHDIFFLDIGPVFDDHEGDVGRAFTVGDDEEHQRCARDVGEIWFEVRQHWKDAGVTGKELYKFAAERAESRGWRLLLKNANGHRVADFPHTARHRGTIQGWKDVPAANRWILEIQIRHPTRSFGAFYEDLLN